jgi:hypothetical protein
MHGVKTFFSNIKEECELASAEHMRYCGADNGLVRSPSEARFLACCNYNIR